MRTIKAARFIPYSAVFILGIMLLGASYGCLAKGWSTFWIAATGGVGASLIATSAAACWLLIRKELVEELYQNLHNEFTVRGVTSVFTNRENEIAEGRWSELIRSTKKGGKCNILGIALGKWSTDSRTWDAIRECVAKEAEVTVLFLNPISFAATKRASEDRWRNTQQSIVHAMENFWRFRESLPDEHKERLSLMTYDTTPSCSIAWANGTMIVSHYIVAKDNRYSPGWELHDVSMSKNILRRLSRLPTGGGKQSLFDIYKENFEIIKRDSVRISETSINDYKQQLSM